MAPIRIYTIPACPYCKLVKDFFARHAVAYEEYDVMSNRVARAEMAAKSHQLGVPVVDTGEEIFVGFDRSGLEKAIGIR